MRLEERIYMSHSELRGEVYVNDRLTERQLFMIPMEDIEEAVELHYGNTDANNIREYVLDAFYEEIVDLLDIEEPAMMQVLNATLPGKVVKHIIDNSSEDMGDTFVIVMEDGTQVSIRCYDNKLVVEEY